MTHESKLCHRMVEQQIRRRGIRDQRILDAMRRVERHLFVPSEFRDQAYEDYPLPIGEGQTISQPYIVALMTSLLEVDEDARVLEIGTGCGYQAAVLAELVAEVHTVEILPELAEEAEERLARLGYKNVHVHRADGHLGWPEAAPYDGILVTAAPLEIPPALIEQLRMGARLVIPVGGFFQDLMLVTCRPDGIRKRNVTAVRFVPMTGGTDE